MEQLGYIQFATHRVNIYKDHESSVITCFKSNDRRCELEIFSSIEDATEYVIQPLPSMTYWVGVHGEDDGPDL